MKSLLSSKTFWLAIIQAVAGVIAIFATTYPGVGELLVVKSVVDIILRMLTTDPITHV